MFRFIKNTIALVIFATLIYVGRDYIREEVVPGFQRLTGQIFQSAPCEEPIKYNLGTFDTEFGVSQKYVIDALADAEVIWEKSYGKDLFIYTPDKSGVDVVKVNLIYDYRQETTSELKEVSKDVDMTRASYEELKQVFNQKKSAYEAEKRSLASAVTSFGVRNDAYKEKVEYWNVRGGAPQKEYKELQNEKAALEKLAQDLQNRQTALNERVNEINDMVGELNRAARELNINVDTYNTIGAERGESFEEGIYKSDGINREIEIYEFSSRDKLVRVFAHEFGHALGLDHVTDSKAIMYESNEGKALATTEADLAALRSLCEKK